MKLSKPQAFQQTKERVYQKNWNVEKKKEATKSDVLNSLIKNTKMNYITNSKLNFSRSQRCQSSIQSSRHVRKDYQNYQQIHRMSRLKTDNQIQKQTKFRTFMQKNQTSLNNFEILEWPDIVSFALENESKSKEIPSLESINSPIKAKRLRVKMKRRNESSMGYNQTLNKAIRKKLVFKNCGDKKIITKRMTQFVLAYENSYNQPVKNQYSAGKRSVSVYVRKTLPSFPKFKSKECFEDKVYLRRFLHHIEYYKNRIHEKYNLLATKIDRLQFQTQSKNPFLYQIKKSECIDTINKLREETVYLISLINKSTLKKNVENFSKWFVRDMKTFLPGIKGIVGSLNILADLIQNQEVFEDYVKEKVANKNNRQVFFTRIAIQLDSKLKNYDPLQAQNKIIVNYIKQYKQKSFEAQSFKRAHEIINKLVKSEGILKQNKKDNPALGEQIDIILDTFKLTHRLKHAVKQENYQYFLEVVQAELQQQKYKMKGISELAFYNIDRKIEQNDKWNYWLLKNSFIQKFNINSIKSSLKDDQFNFIFLEKIVNTFTCKDQIEKKTKYQESLDSLIAFIGLKNFVINFHEVVKQCNDYLHEEDVTHCYYLSNCAKIMVSFAKLDDYTNNEFKDICKRVNTSNIFRKYQDLADNINKFKETINLHKAELLKLILKSINDLKKTQKNFFKGFTINTKVEEIEKFILKQRTIQHLFGKINLYMSIFGEDQHELEEELSITAELVQHI